MAQPSMQQVKTLWEYLDQDKTLLRAFLPPDVIELSLQVKTTQGMHQIQRDAWAGHSHSFKKWGSQIQPTGSTRAKILKFRDQWSIYQNEVARRANSGSGSGRNSHYQKEKSLPVQGQPQDQTATPFPGKGVVTPVKWSPQSIEITPVSSRGNSISLLHTSPISSDDEVPALVSPGELNIKQEPTSPRPGEHLGGQPDF